jgi:dihydropyrimidinase/dihydroorotase
MASETVDLKVTNARVVAEAGTYDGGVAVADGKITALGSDRSLPDAERTIDAGGNYLIPGFIEPHVHLSAGPNDSPTDLRNNFETETRGGLHRGVTTVIHFLSQDRDERYEPDWEFFTDVGEDNSYIDFAYHAILHSDEHEKDIDFLLDHGVRSFKLYFNWYKYAAPQLDIGHSTAGRVYRVQKKLADVPGAVTMYHCENDDFSEERRKEIRDEAGRTDLEAWSDASPNISESMQVEHVAKLTQFTDSKSYIVHMSTAESVDVVERYQQEGVNIYAETLPAFLCHTKHDDLGVWGKISPPLRGERSNRRLWEALRTGVVDHVGTDQVPFGLEMKEPEGGRYGNIWKAPPGDNNGLEYLLPVIMSEGVNKNRISMRRAVEVGATNNAKMWGLYPRKGVIAEGADADMAVVDMDRTETVDEDFYHTSDPRYSSFHGWELTGIPTHTIRDGELAVEEGELLVEKGGRDYLPRYEDGAPQ